VKNSKYFEQRHETLKERICEIEAQLNMDIDKTWVPKSLAIVSIHPMYDYFNRILEDLLDKMCNPQGMLQTFE